MFIHCDLRPEASGHICSWLGKEGPTWLFSPGDPSTCSDGAGGLGRDLRGRSISTR